MIVKLMDLALLMRVLKGAIDEGLSICEYIAPLNYDEGEIVQMIRDVEDKVREMVNEGKEDF